MKYNIALSVGNKTYKAAGNTTYAALKKIKLEPPKAMGIMKVTTEGVEHDIPIRLTPLHLKSLFGKDLNLKIFAKRLTTLA